MCRNCIWMCCCFCSWIYCPWCRSSSSFYYITVGFSWISSCRKISTITKINYPMGCISWSSNIKCNCISSSATNWCFIYICWCCCVCSRTNRPWCLIISICKKSHRCWCVNYYISCSFKRCITTCSICRSISISCC